ncbi:MAG TPA: gluconokinase [Terriglobales bacterium]|jgi:gluconokinase|nr:gluconokinase [Terriglobales bacterium]
MIIVVMGVTGVGKTTIGSALALKLGCDFKDADAYHSAANIEKMSHGIPLTDADRIPWLEAMRAVLGSYAADDQGVVLACSALRESYRAILGKDLILTWIYLKASADVICQRIEHRHGHFAKEDLLKSQFDTLEEPRDVIVVNAEPPEDQVVAEAMSKLTAQQQVSQ